VDGDGDGLGPVSTAIPLQVVSFSNSGDYIRDGEHIGRGKKGVLESRNGVISSQGLGSEGSNIVPDTI
jgi:hypothetical protein